MANKKSLNLLSSVIAAMANADAPFLMVEQKDLKELLAEGLVETNPEMTDGNKIATRATEKGTALNNEKSAIDNSTTTASPYAVFGGVVLPEAKAHQRASKFPFDTMEVGQGFFIPNTEDKPEVAKSMQSTISSANARFRKAGKGNKFRVVAVTAGEQLGEFTAPANGALVTRVADAEVAAA